ncbi:TPA: hypothetical protein N0F65_011457 [Lagenidium giganteum]|uniref:HSF-type DNA-binding domain-containing protein n=1 Tax=Lagenidium giganteum TaxID=4803 RepID=A0AAV2ZB62_9STRA|nr:TPA: hypothetical protein N0F65_011457 [Lagenidium giganteum]
MPPGIATGFVRKLYRILDHESAEIVAWDASGASFSIHDSDKLNDTILPRYFRGRLCAFRQQLIDHGFEQVECEDNENRECYRHENFLRRCPERLSLIVRNPKPKRKGGATMVAKPTLNSPSARSPKALSLQANGVPAVASPANSGDLMVPLKVNLSTNTVMLKRHRAAQDGADSGDKRARSSPHAANHGGHSGTPSPSNQQRRLPANPLFARDRKGADQAFNRMTEVITALLPKSSELPEPISYLNQKAPSPPSSVASSTPPVFSDDMIKSALYFLVSSSTTGTENVAANNPAKAFGDEVNNSLAFPPPVMPVTGENPLFSSKKESMDDDDEDSVWNLLMASSIDRVKTVISDVNSPQERMNLIIRERERLEQQRKQLMQNTKPPLQPRAQAPAASTTKTRPTHHDDDHDSLEPTIHTHASK